MIDKEKSLSLHPKYASSLIGHQPLVAQIRALYQAKRFPHGFLFHGPQGIGKATLAHHMAWCLLTDRMGTFGQSTDSHCSVLSLLQAGHHPDCLVVEKLTDEQGKIAKDIAIESVRLIPKFFAQKSLQGNWRIAIVDRLDDLSIKGANLLLKTLEEPPEKSILILIADNLDAVLPTVRSRVMAFRFAPLSQEDTTEVLQQFLTLDEAKFLSQISYGRPGLALMIAKLGGQVFYQKFLSVVQDIAQGKAHSFYGFIEQDIFKNGTLSPDEAYQMVYDFLSNWIVMTLVHLFQEEVVQPPEQQESLRIARQLFETQTAEYWVKLWFGMHQIRDETRIYSLDKKQTLICLFQQLSGLN